MEKNFSKGGALSVDKLIEERANILRLIVAKQLKLKTLNLIIRREQMQFQLTTKTDEGDCLIFKGISKL